jgi:hypothetical protein
LGRLQQLLPYLALTFLHITCRQQARFVFFLFFLFLFFFSSLLFLLMSSSRVVLVYGVKVQQSDPFSQSLSVRMWWDVGIGDFTPTESKMPFIPLTGALQLHQGS